MGRLSRPSIIPGLVICAGILSAHAAIGPVSKTVRPTAPTIYAVFPTTLSQRTSEMRAFDTSLKQVRKCLRVRGISVERIVADRLILKLPNYELSAFPWVGPREADGMTPGVVLSQTGSAPQVLMVT